MERRKKGQKQNLLHRLDALTEQVETLRRNIQHNVDASETGKVLDVYSFNPLHAAAKQGDAHQVRTLLENFRARNLINSRDHTGLAAAHHAALVGRRVTFLLAHRNEATLDRAAAEKLLDSVAEHLSAETDHIPAVDEPPLWVDLDDESEIQTEYGVFIEVALKQSPPPPQWPSLHELPSLGPVDLAKVPSSLEIPVAPAAVEIPPEAFSTLPQTGLELQLCHVPDVTSFSNRSTKWKAKGRLVPNISLHQATLILRSALSTSPALSPDAPDFWEDSLQELVSPAQLCLRKIQLTELGSFDIKGPIWVQIRLVDENNFSASTMIKSSATDPLLDAAVAEPDAAVAAPNAAADPPEVVVDASDVVATADAAAAVSEDGIRTQANSPAPVTPINAQIELKLPSPPLNPCTLRVFLWEGPEEGDTSDSGPPDEGSPALGWRQISHAQLSLKLFLKPHGSTELSMDVDSPSGEKAKITFHYTLVGEGHRPPSRSSPVEEHSSIPLIIRDGPACLAAILTSGGDANFGDLMGATALHKAAARDDIPSAALLLRAGGALDTQDTTGDQCLHRAAANGCTAAGQFFIKRGSDLDAVNENGDTPLHFACEKGHCDFVNLLLSSGAAVVKPNLLGWSPAHTAAAKGQQGALTLIVAHCKARRIGLSQLQAAPTGETIVHIALRGCRLNMLKWMMDKGFGPSTLLENKQGHTPLDVLDAIIMKLDPTATKPKGDGKEDAKKKGPKKGGVKVPPFLPDVPPKARMANLGADGVKGLVELGKTMQKEQRAAAADAKKAAAIAAAAKKKQDADKASKSKKTSNKASGKSENAPRQVIT